MDTLPIEIILHIFEYIDIEKAFVLLKKLNLEIPKKFKRRLINEHIKMCPMFCFFCGNRTSIKYYFIFADECYNCYFNHNIA